MTDGYKERPTTGGPDVTSIALTSTVTAAASDCLVGRVLVGCRGGRHDHRLRRLCLCMDRERRRRGERQLARVVSGCHSARIPGFVACCFSRGGACHGAPGTPPDALAAAVALSGSRRDCDGPRALRDRVVAQPLRRASQVASASPM